MVKKIKRITILLIAVIIVAAAAAIGIVSNQSIKAVNGVAMEQNTSERVLLKWDKVKKADGYYIYYSDLSDSENSKYKKLGEVEGGDNCSYEITDLSGATVYNIKVKAYKVYLNKEYVSQEASEVKVYSLPDALEVSAFSGSKGILSADWDSSDNIAGYEIKYSTDSDFSDSAVIEVDSADTRNISVSGLNPGDIYYVSGRAYLIDNDDKIYGEWGEVSSTVINENDLDIGNINPNKPMVALTFDDGPAYTYDGENTTDRILDVLEEYNAHATFFMVGERVNDSTADLLKREIQLGCELGNHTYSHTHYGSDVTAKDISKASKRIEKYSGQSPTIFRCPGGELTSTIRKECKKENMPLAYWSVDTEDWKSKDADKIYKKVIKQAYDGAIILMHDIYPTTADAVEKIVPKLIEKGYQIVTVTELIEAKTGEKPKAGQQYVDYDTINNNTK